MKLFSYIIVFLLVASACHSLEYFMDLEIAIDNNGDSRVVGHSNVAVLDLKPINDNVEGESSQLTAKKGLYWTFNLAAGNLSASYVKVKLPKYAVINHIKSQLSIGLASENNIITATFSGQNKPSDITIQYSIAKKDQNYFAAIIIIAVMLIAVSIIFFLKKSKKELGRLSAIRPTLNETQVKIIDALLEKKGEASQTTLKYLTGIPKASLSRNIELMAQKEIVQKFFNGTTNYIKLHPRMKQ